MGKALNLLKWSVTLGKEPQSFLGAGWIPGFLKRVSDKNKQKWALRILSLSPHYFMDGDRPEFAKMSSDEYLEFAHKRAAEGRETIYTDILKPYLKNEMSVLDYGCGPGYLAKVISPHVRKIYACDLSTGALACADIINHADNIEYVSVTNNGLDKISDSSLDAVYSFAVIQHLTDDAFDIVLQNAAAKLKTGGQILFHVQLEDEVWRTEDEWRDDSSVTGRLKFRYGLHCFERTVEKHREMAAKHGFVDIEFNKLSEMDVENPEEVHTQALMTACKS